MCVPGTAVVTRGGEVKLILERQGAALRAFDAEKQDYMAVAAAFRTGKLFQNLHLLTVRSCPDGAGALLEEAGFVREMRDYVLERNHYNR